MGKWSGTPTPVGTLRRLFSAVRSRPGGGVGDVGTILSRSAALQRRPPTVKRGSVLENSCSFIGKITAQVRVCSNKMGVFTFLEVNGTPGNQITLRRPFEICLYMKGELAQVALQYVQQEQYVYVSGCLCSYNKTNLTLYRVDVKELNVVRIPSQNEVPCRSDDKLKKEEMRLSASNTSSDSYDLNKEEWIKEQLILWQIFFANPCEWWDRRATKFSPRQPDFKHKSTGEALWIRSYDPPWVKKQLNLYYSQKSEANLFRKKDDYGLQGWKMQDFDRF